MVMENGVGIHKAYHSIFSVVFFNQKSLWNENAQVFIRKKKKRKKIDRKKKKGKKISQYIGLSLDAST